MEKWKKITNFPNYEVSDKGNIKTLNRNGKNKVLKELRDGYLGVHLYKNGKAYNKKVHRLVAEAFIDGNKSLDINHKDGNKHNNQVDNLEWITKSDNMKHAYRTGLAKPHPTYGMKGKKNPNGGRRGNKVEVVETGKIYKNAADCARQLKISDKRIIDCLNNKQKSHAGYHFRKVN